MCWINVDTFRPSARKWHEHLLAYTDAEQGKAVICTKNPGHVHFSKGCPWCALEEAEKRPDASRSQQSGATQWPGANPITRNANASSATTDGLTITPIDRKTVESLDNLGFEERRRLSVKRTILTALWTALVYGFLAYHIINEAYINWLFVD